MLGKAYFSNMPFSKHLFVNPKAGSVTEEEWWFYIEELMKALQHPDKRYADRMLVLIDKLPRVLGTKVCDGCGGAYPSSIYKHDCNREVALAKKSFDPEICPLTKKAWFFFDALVNSPKVQKCQNHGALLAEHLSSLLDVYGRQQCQHCHKMSPIHIEFHTRRCPVTKRNVRQQSADKQKEHNDKFHANGHQSLDQEYPSYCELSFDRLDTIHNGPPGGPSFS